MIRFILACLVYSNELAYLVERTHVKQRHSKTQQVYTMFLISVRDYDGATAALQISSGFPPELSRALARWVAI